MKVIRPQDLVLRCYAERERDGTWFTICIDLNLYARGDSMEEAREKLHAFILRYIREAFEEDRAHFFDLVPRRAPLYFRMRWQYIKLMCKLQRLFDNDNNNRLKPGSNSIPFKEQLPVTAVAA